MKTRFYFLTILSFVFTLQLSAQTEDEYKNSKDYAESLAGSHSNTVLLKDQRYTEIKGSPYFNDDWKQGNVIEADGKIIQDVPLKYNAYENELYAKIKGDDILIINNETIKGFVIEDGDTKHIFVKEDVLKYKGHFFEVMAKGQVTVLKKHHVNLFKSDNNSGYQMEKSNTLKKTSKYFIQVSTKQFQVFKRNKKSLIKQVPSLKVKLKRYFKRKKINLKNDKDLIKTIRWMNEELK